MRLRRDQPPVVYDPPGSRADPEDHARAERAWREFSERIDAEERAKQERAA